MQQAENAGVKAVQLIKTDEDSLAKTLKEHQPDVVVVLDVPHKLSARFLDQFPKQVIGLHPALKDQFPGENAVSRAYDAYRAGEIKWSGCNTHYVLPDGKAGEMLRQVVVPVEPKDTPERFAARMRKGEKWVLLKGVKQHLYELRMKKRKRS
jgi:folate-dependent phosphoribosylglycinamide formyltransferase PurN